MAYWRGIRLFGTTQPPQLVQKLKNTQYIHQSRTRVLRIFAARTWVNNPCASCQTYSSHDLAPADRRMDPSDPIGVVLTDIFGAPGRGRSRENPIQRLA